MAAKRKPTDKKKAEEVKQTTEAIEEAKQDQPQFEGIAILGSHPKTVEHAPFDKSWLIYACSPHNIEKRTLPRVDQWFEVHVPIADKTRQYPYLKHLEMNKVAQNPPHCGIGRVEHHRGIEKREKDDDHHRSNCDANTQFDDH